MEELRCVLCKEVAEFIATETNEPICRNCMEVNESIKQRWYPEKLDKFKPKEIEHEQTKD